MITILTVCLNFAFSIVFLCDQLKRLSAAISVQTSTKMSVSLQKAKHITSRINAHSSITALLTLKQEASLKEPLHFLMLCIIVHSNY